MTNDQRDPKVAVKAAMAGTAPERKDELAKLWSCYDPAVELVQKAGNITLNATERPDTDRSEDNGCLPGDSGAIFRISRLSGRLHDRVSADPATGLPS